jgi:hypothetical protein
MYVCMMYVGKAVELMPPVTRYLCLACKTMKVRQAFIQPNRDEVEVAVDRTVRAWNKGQIELLGKFRLH